jgi:hypothetical protein
MHRVQRLLTTFLIVVAVLTLSVLGLNERVKYKKYKERYRDTRQQLLDAQAQVQPSTTQPTLTPTQEQFAKLEANIRILQADGEDLLRRLITCERPELLTPGLSAWDTVNILREWTAEVIDEGHGATTTSHREQQRLGVARLVNAFYLDEIGVLCAGSAVTLRDICHLFGYESFALNMAIANRFSHVVTVVRIDHWNRSILCIQDPYLDVTYVDADGNPYDLLDLVQTLTQRRHEDIHIRSGNAGPRDHLCVATDEYRARCETRGIELFPVASRPGRGWAKIRRKHTFADMEKWAARKMHLMKAKGVPEDLKYLFLFPVSISYDDLTLQREKDEHND